MHVDDLKIPLGWEKARALESFLEGLSREQVAWVSGYLAGLSAVRQETVTPVPAQTSLQVTVLYGSQTGNAEKLAANLRARLVQAGIAARVENLADYRRHQLKRERCLLLVTSTYGEGEPPDSAREFHAFVMGDKGPRLEGLKFAVLALGDRSYERFCQTGRDFDSRLEALGAQRIYPRLDCDLDYEEPASEWIEAVVEVLARQGLAAPMPDTLAGGLSHSRPAAARSLYTRKNPYPATLVENLRITGRGSSKDVRHLELALEGLGLAFEPGDSLGVLPENCPELVAELLEALKLSAETSVRNPRGEEVPLRQALLRDYEITVPIRPFLEGWAQLAGDRVLAELLKEENAKALKGYLAGREIIDVVRDHPVKGLAPQRFVDLLRPLPPRLYSIASSPKTDPEAVHLTVGVVRYESHGRSRKGVASTFLAERIPEGGTVPVYVHANPNFRLPEDPDTSIIMVGAGTGIAPFRAFIEERAAVGARGRNWLIFGDRQFRTDFLYQREWLDYRKQGLLKINVAFSRDGATKDYVQHRLLESSRELYAWLEEGAHFYVCGDASRLAPDVHQALIQIVSREGARSREEAQTYVQQLQTQKRYQRDVY